MSQTAPTLLVNHTFQGGRFVDHGVDVDVLEELARYKGLLFETAKELWRQRNPSRERLPKNFEDSLQLKFYEVKCNCATLPLCRQLATDEQGSMFPDKDELTEAVDLVADTIDAASMDRPLPQQFPRRLLTCFNDYGKSLADDEWIEQTPAQSTRTIRYDATARTRLRRYADVAYEDHVDLTGTVTMARVTKPKMAIELSDGREIEAAFRAEDEATITTALKDHATVKLRVIGTGFHNGSGQLQRLVHVQSVTLLVSGIPQFDASAKPIWEQFDAITSTLSADDLASLPKDGAEHHDRYISTPQGAGK